MARQTTPVTPEVSEQPPTSVVISTGGAANLHTWRNIGLIIGREYKNRVKQRSFIISTVLLMILIAIAACLPTIIQLIASRTNAQTHVTVVNNAGSIANFSDTQLMQYLDSSLNGSAAQSSGTSSGKPQFVLQTSTADQVNSLRQSVKNGDLNILLVIDRAGDQSLQFTYYTNVNIVDDTHLSQVQGLAGELSVLDKSARLGLTPEQTGSLFTQPVFNFVNTQQGGRSIADQLAGYFIAYAGVLLIFMTVFLYGNGVAAGAAEEKGSRIMEILVNAATPFQLMVGKIIGIGAAGLTQMFCLVAVGIGVLLLQSPLQSALLGSTSGGILGLNITSTSITLLLLVLVYFILGYLLYATLFAALGALVKRQDEVQNAVQPLTWLFMIGYLASAVGGVASADTVWMKVLSFVPFWTPTVMLMRIGGGSVAWWEVLVSILVMIVFIFLCAVLAARIYRFAVLMYGQRPSIRQLFRIASAK
jgi:ABC-2 type transport system permease protein